LGAQPQGDGTGRIRPAAGCGASAPWRRGCRARRLHASEFIRAWEGRILNIHPSLLPAYKGLDTHRRALLAGEEYTGCSVHIVTEELDEGPVLAQAEVKIRGRDTPETLAARVLEEEHRLYPRALDAFCRTLFTEYQPTISSGLKK
jgi:folate-dependent phosphoribosylglycinamide formyltransferase PurN